MEDIQDQKKTVRKPELYVTLTSGVAGFEWVSKLKENWNK